MSTTAYHLPPVAAGENQYIPFAPSYLDGSALGRFRAHAPSSRSGRARYVLAPGKEARSRVALRRSGARLDVRSQPDDPAGLRTEPSIRAGSSRAFPPVTKPQPLRAAIHAVASRLEGVVEGVACAGTKAEAKTYCVGGQAFLFVSRAEPVTVRFKVSTSAARATKAGAIVGAGGWTKLVLANALPAGFAEWVAESRSLLQPATSKVPTVRKATGRSARKSERTR